MPYQPINCGFYDELEARATMRRRCALYWLTADGEARTQHGVIADLFIDPTDRAEYLRCTDGFTLRLDQLTAVDDRPVPQVC